VLQQNRPFRYIKRVLKSSEAGSQSLPYSSKSLCRIIGEVVAALAAAIFFSTVVLAQTAKSPNENGPAPQRLGAPQRATTAPPPHRRQVSSALAFKCFLVGFDNEARMRACLNEGTKQSAPSRK
jgi:hypothetical protein